MNKIILTLAAVMVGLTAAAANPFSVSNRTRLNPQGIAGMRTAEITETIKSERAIISRADADGEVDYTLAGEPYQALGFQSQSAGMQVAMATQIESDFLNTITDGEITAISFYTGAEYGSNNINKLTKAYVFITDNLQKDFLYVQEVQVPSTSYTKVNVPLETPFTITPGSDVFFGVYYTLTGAYNMALVVDGMGHLNDNGGWYGARANSKDSWQWDNLAAYYGFVTVGATIKANNLPKNQVSVIAAAGQPVASVGEPFGFQFLMRNNGTNSISTITVEYGLEGETPMTDVFEITDEWAFNQLLIAAVELTPAKGAKSTNAYVKVTALDDQPNTGTPNEASYSLAVVPEGKGLPRNVVIEEFTSISCSACPVGYTSMEKIHEEYTDGSIIPVCIHVNIPGKDPLTVSSFSNLVNKFTSEGVPTSTINRSETVYPLYVDLIETAENYLALPGLAQVTAEATLDRENSIVTVNTKTKFAFDYTDGNKQFILSYAITEDNVGPYNQKNGYSGYTEPVLGGWEKQPANVSLIYNDVARLLDRYAGITGSVPAEIVGGEEYEFTHDVKLTAAVEDPDNINLVVYLINRKTSEIENACTIKNVADASAGIESVVNDDPNAPVEYFNLQGIRIDEPSNGVFIRRQGKNVSKVLVK